MTQMEITVLEEAGRSAMVWSPEGYDGRVHLGAVLIATSTALGILTVAAAFLLAAF
jgi:hypothetical protein